MNQNESPTASEYFAPPFGAQTGTPVQVIYPWPRFHYEADIAEHSDNTVLHHGLHIICCVPNCLCFRSCCLRSLVFYRRSQYFRRPTSRRTVPRGRAWPWNCSSAGWGGCSRAPALAPRHENCRGDLGPKVGKFPSNGGTCR